MATPNPGAPEGELLPAKLAERLLERASELDASSAKVAELRVAAQEAGISPAAFDAALAELKGEKPQAPDMPADVNTNPVRGLARMVIAVLVAGLIAGLAIRLFGS